MSQRQGSGKGADSRNLLEGPLLGKILMFALPLAASNILQQLFNSADIAVVGRFAGSTALAAVGSNGPVINLLINLFNGLSIGANVVIAAHIGSGKREKIQNAIHTAILLSLISGVCLLFVGQAAAEPILSLIGTPADVMRQAVLYLRLYFTGMPFFMLYNFGAAILRSRGDTKRPLYALLISGLANVALNLFFVVVCHMGVAGVAVATVLANGISAAIICGCLMREEEQFRLHPRQLRLHREELLQIIRIGAPAGVQGMIFSLSNLCIQSAINSFGSDAVAGSASASNFELFSYFIVNSFTQATVTFTSQNYGARKYDRCKRVFRLCFLCAILFTGALCTAFVAGRNTLILFYTVDPAVISYALVRILRACRLGFLSVAFEIPGGALRGMGYSMLPTIITVFGSCALRFVWVYTIFRMVNSFEMLMNVYPVTWLVTGILMTTVYFLARRKAFAVTEEAGRQQ